MLLLGTGWHPNASEEEKEIARKLLMEAPEEILESKEDIHWVPNAKEDWHRPEDVWIFSCVLIDTSI